MRPLLEPVRARTYAIKLAPLGVQRVGPTKGELRVSVRPGRVVAPFMKALLYARVYGPARHRVVVELPHLLIRPSLRYATGLEPALT